MRCDGLDLCPGVERPFLKAPPERVRHASLGRVVVEQLPGDSPVEHLSKRLRRLVAMTFRDRHPPFAHLLRRELDQPDIAKRGRRLAQQPAQLRHRHWLTWMRQQILLDELDQRQGRRPSARTEPVERLAKRPLRLRSAREPTDLPSAGTAALQAVPIGPQWLAVRAVRLQLEHLSLAAPSLHLPARRTNGGRSRTRLTPSQTQASSRLEEAISLMSAKVKLYLTHA